MSATKEKNLCVLVAEDDLFQRLALLDFLAICKFDAVEAEDGQVALQKMRDPNNCFDLVLLDLMMPHMNGYEVLTEIKDDPKLS